MHVVYNFACYDPRTIDMSSATIGKAKRSNCARRSLILTANPGSLRSRSKPLPYSSIVLNGSNSHGNSLDDKYISVHQPSC